MKALILSLLAFTALATHAAEPAIVGRFQIITGVTKTGISTAAGASTVDRPVLIKLDTTTGEAWEYVSLFNAKTGNQLLWVPIHTEPSIRP